MVCQDRLWITVYGNSKHKRAFRADGDGSSRCRGGDCGRHGQRGGGDEGAETPSRSDLKTEVVNHLPRQARDKHEEMLETVETVGCFAGRRRAAAVLHRLDRVVWRLGAAARRNSALAAREPHAGTTLDYFISGTFCKRDSLDFKHFIGGSPLVMHSRRTRARTTGGRSAAAAS